MVADEAVTQLIDLALVPLHDDVERLALPREARLDQLAVVGVGEPLRRRRSSDVSCATLVFQPGRTGADQIRWIVRSAAHS